MPLLLPCRPRTCSAPIPFGRPPRLPAPASIVCSSSSIPPPPPPPPSTLTAAAAAVALASVPPSRLQLCSSSCDAHWGLDIARPAPSPPPSSQRRRMPPAHDEEPPPPPTAASNPRVLSPSSQPPYPSPVTRARPNRWSLRNAFSPLAPPPQLRADFSPAQIQVRSHPRRLVRPRTGGRLWNPTNSTPRTPRPRSPAVLEAPPVAPVPLQHPRISSEAAAVDAGIAYPLLTLQEQRQTRHSFSGTPRGSLQVEYNSSASGSTRISLPRSVSLDLRRSVDVDGTTTDKGKGKEVESGGILPAVAPSARAAPPVTLKPQTLRKTHKGKGKAREIDLQMASPDLEAGATHPTTQLYTADGRSALPTNLSTTSLSQQSAQGVAPPLSVTDESSLHGSVHSVVIPGEDAEWGPSHPCYPHLNPHVPISSPLYQSTRIIRIRRDWMLEGDMAPTFSGLYPEILADAGLGEGEFRRVVEDVNAQLIPVFNPWGWRNILDVILGLLTGWIWDDLGWTFIKGKLRDVERSLERWNESLQREGGAGGGGMPARFVPLRRSGYMTLDIQIPTPQIGEIGQEALEAEHEEDDGQRSRKTHHTTTAQEGESSHYAGGTGSGPV